MSILCSEDSERNQPYSPSAVVSFFIYLFVPRAFSSEPGSRSGPVLKPGLQHDAGAEGARLPPAVRISDPDGPGELFSHAGPQLPQHGAAA